MSRSRLPSRYGESFGDRSHAGRPRRRFLSRAALRLGGGLRRRPPPLLRDA